MSQIRVSVANLAWYVRLNEDNAVASQFGILNPSKLAKGERSYMALGGGAMLTKKGKQMIECTFGATNFEFDDTTGFYDARFQIDDSELDRVFAVFESIDGVMKCYEQDPMLDIIAELSGKEFPRYPTILTEAEVALVYPLFVKTVRQKLSALGTDTSSRAKAEMPTHRLFRIFELGIPSSLLPKFTESKVVRILLDSELASTDCGSKAGKTRDGFTIQNNLFIA